MPNEIEVAGSLAEAALVARVVEKTGSAGESESEGKVTTATLCLNCGTPMIGSHCHACGQPAHIHRSISAFWHDILHGVLHFDGKFWNTLPLLAWQPGKLTRRYIHGERAKFISPMAIFLFAIFMMFAVFSYVGSPDFSDAEDGGATEIADTDASAEKDAEEKARLIDKIAEIEKELAEAKPGSQQTGALQIQLNVTQNAVNTIDMVRGEKTTYPEAAGAALMTDQTNVIAVDDIVEAATANEDKGLVLNNSAGVITGIKSFDDWAKKALKKANSNPELLLYKLQSNGYKFAWLLIPISIPFVWLVTIGTKGHRFYDHAVFTTYSLAFMSLLFIACALSVKFNLLPGLIITASTLYAPFHIYRQLRHAYQLSRIGAVLRFFILFIFINIAAIIFMFALMTLGLLSS